MQLEQFPAFVGLNATQIQNFLRACSERHLGEGEHLIHIGEEGSELHFATEGKFRVYVSTEHGEQELAVVAAPCVIGEVEFLCGRKNSASVQALSNASVLAIPFEEMRRRLGDSDSAALKVIANIAKVMAIRLSDVGQRVTEIINASSNHNNHKNELEGLKRKLFSEWSV